MQASAALFLLATTFLPPGPPALVSQERGEVFPQEPGEYLTVYLMTVGQGDAVWERFGHNALVFRDDRSDRFGLDDDAAAAALVLGLVPAQVARRLIRVCKWR